MKRTDRTAVGVAMALVFGGGIAGLDGATAEESVMPAVAARSQRMVIETDRATVMPLPESFAAVVVGNPAIVDVSFHERPGVAVLMGRSLGSTNMLVLSEKGTVVASYDLDVVASDRSLVTIHRGEKRETYSCNPRCGPTVSLGDGGEHFGEALQQAVGRAQAIEGFAGRQGSSAAASGSPAPDGNAATEGSGVDAK